MRQPIVGLVWRQSEFVYTDEGHGIKASGRWGECCLAGAHGPREGSGKFYAWDASTYAAGLTTRSDFGCVEHEVEG